MRTVSFQGGQLSASQRRNLQLRQQVTASFINPALQAQIDQTIEQLEQRKEQGAKPERIWFVDRIDKGPPWVGDCFGF